MRKPRETSTEIPQVRLSDSQVHGMWTLAVPSWTTVSIPRQCMSATISKATRLTDTLITLAVNLFFEENFVVS